MKAVIEEVTFSKEIDSKFGKLYSFKVKYDGEVATGVKRGIKRISRARKEFTEETKLQGQERG